MTVVSDTELTHGEFTLIELSIVNHWRNEEFIQFTKSGYGAR